MTKAYSYVRFSTPNQGRYDSVRRQIALAGKYADEHDLSLDDSLSFRDLGVSAYAGDNFATGKLGDFLFAVREGMVEPGSFLIVESLDRISRQKARRSMRVLEQICDEDITVVTLMDNQVYTSERLDNDPTSLLISLVIFMRAHEESRIKGARVQEAWLHKFDIARKSKEPMSRRCPTWLQYDDGRFKVIRDRAAVVRKIYELRLAEVGAHRIARYLNRSKVATWSRNPLWDAPRIKQILKSQSVTGVLVPRKSKREGWTKTFEELEPIKGYYPRIVPQETFEKVKQINAKKTKSMYGKTGGRQTRNIFGWLAKCPICKGTMKREVKSMFNYDAPITPHFVCHRGEIGGECEVIGVPYHPLERYFVEQGPKMIRQHLQNNRGAISEEINLSDALFDKRCMQLANLLERKPLERKKINDAARAVLEYVVIDYPSHKFEFCWKTGEITELPIANFEEVVGDLFFI
jgi:DNA invertase Pin-like site-specific DNA recombinase